MLSSFISEMPRPRTSNRGAYGDGKLQEALTELSEGRSLRSVSAKYNIPGKTLRRHRDGKVRKPGSLKFGRYDTDLPPEHEEALVEKIKVMEKMLYGLSTVDIRRLAYEYAEKIGVQHRFRHENKMAGKEWLRGFLARHPELSIRKPEGTSMARAVGFNRAQVTRFFDLYKDLAREHKYTGMRVWNMDETGLSSVQQPVNVVAQKGKKRVGKMTSGEKGKTVTVLCAANAAGQFVPPMFIYSRARLQESLLNGAPVGSIGACTKSGWTDQTCFLTWLHYFIQNVNPSKDRRHVLILDGHHSHKSLQALELASQNGVDIITLPPHSTHRLQPLDVVWFKSLKANYNKEADNWLMSNPGRRISDFEVAGIFAKAYGACTSTGKMEKGFRTCGLWPIDDSVFTEDDFAASLMTEEPEPGSGAHAATSSSQPGGEASSATCSGQPGGEASSAASSGQSGDEANSAADRRRPGGETSSATSSGQSGGETSSAASSGQSGGEASSAADRRRPGGEASSAASSGQSGGEASSAASSGQSGGEASSAADSSQPGGEASSATCSGQPGGEASSAADSSQPGGEASSAASSGQSGGEASSAADSSQPGGEASSAASSGQSGGEASSATSSGQPGGEASSAADSRQPGGEASSATSSGQPVGEASSATSSGQPGGEASSAADRRRPGGETSSATSSGQPGYSSAADTILEEICRTPKAQKRTRSRRAERSMVLTSSPYKAELRGKKKNKDSETTSARKEQAGGKKRKAVAERETKGAAKKGACGSSDDTTCYVCRMRFAMSCEEWIKCNACDRWACLPCTDADAKQVSFICDMCR